MTWLARLRPLVAGAAVLIIATAGVAVLGRQESDAEATRKRANTSPPAVVAGGVIVPALEGNRALAREQLALIDKAWDVQRRLARSSRVDINDASFSLWGRRRLDALRRTGAAKAEIIAAMEKYINDLKEDEVVAKAQKEAARATELAVYDVQYRRMEAEIWLNEEKAR